MIALGVGIWLGLPGRYEQSIDELEKSLDAKQRRRRRKKRSISPLAWVQRSGKSADARRGGLSFKIEDPDDL